ncbi:MAG: glycine dehydrogenase (aminomethyl-transferring), partial [Ferruginibacter sp.]
MKQNGLSTNNEFINRHIGPSASETNEMLDFLKASSVDELINKTIPAAIRNDKPLTVGDGMSEYAYLCHLQQIASENTIFRNYIGKGYYPTITPSVILRTIFENPGWYTQYTPYQAEIAQGRLESLLNFQTMVSDLTGLPIANASLLDEATAAAEAMALLFHQKNKEANSPTAPRFFVDERVWTQTKDVLLARAKP